MPVVIGLLILIILLLVFGPIILLILALAGVSVVAVLAWVVSKIWWIVLGALALGCVFSFVVYCMDPKGFEEAMKEAEASKMRRDAFNASFKTSSFKKSKNR